MDKIKTMGGLTVIPDCIIDDIKLDKDSVLLLPGSNMLNDSKNNEIIEKSKELLNAGAMVCAICGATTALANAGVLDNRAHTSNGVGFLDMFCPNYKGKEFYIDEPSVVDNNLITASCTGGLMWAKQIIEQLDVFKTETLEYWYKYFSTGEAQYFFSLMQSVAPNDNGNTVR